MALVARKRKISHRKIKIGAYTMLKIAIIALVAFGAHALLGAITLPAIAIHWTLCAAIGLAAAAHVKG